MVDLGLKGMGLPVGLQESRCCFWALQGQNPQLAGGMNTPQGKKIGQPSPPLLPKYLPQTMTNPNEPVGMSKNAPKGNAGDRYWDVD